MLPAFLVPLLGGCSASLESEISGTRAEIVELEKRIPPGSPLWIFDGPDRFDQFLEDPDAGVPEHIHRHLLRKLHDMEVEGLSKGDFDFDACLTDPGAFRGTFWRVQGVIGEFHAEPLSHAGVLFDSKMRPVLFHVVRKPDVLTLRKDSVETQAIFVKWIAYTSKSGRRVTAPFFVGKALSRTL